MNDTSAETHDAVDADIDGYVAAQRRRKLVGAGIAVVIALVGVGGSLVMRADRLPASDAETVKDVREVVDHIQDIPAEMRPELSSYAFAELERERLPAALVGVFEEHSQIPPDMRTPIMLVPFAEDEASLKAWLLACADGKQALADAMMVADGAAGLFERCELGRFGLISRGELGRVSIGELVATHAAWAYLVKYESETELERRVLRLVLGGG
ncbi:hypothetical protein [Enhygromyxa salina]|uniref:Uncharacterized protein n=1 Tax=Enhygromyxa salina TaxID=215803 RepID=A0A2S9YNC5_9BACT|nr:hypothetical protein [Enhygromyxa salina]PRQ06588.1 hypothetical protein ENSA7_37410 [Enhygromyxa salina]